MKNVAKYNLFKGISTVLTVGTPIATMVSCSDMFVHNPDKSISAAGLFTIFIVTMLFKDKIMENFKVPSTFVVCLSLLIFVIMVEKIITPIKYICLTTLVASGIDELTFKQMYKGLELRLPEASKAFKHVGFIFTTTTKLEELSNVN